jgi:hypothetical protein
MAKVLMTVELDYDADIAHGDDPEATAWFFGEILSEEKGFTILTLLFYWSDGSK